MRQSLPTGGVVPAETVVRRSLIFVMTFSNVAVHYSPRGPATLPSKPVRVAGCDQRSERRERASAIRPRLSPDREAGSADSD